MRFIDTTLVVLFALVSFTASAPAQVDSVTITEPFHASERSAIETSGEDGEDTSPSSPLLPRGNNYCSPTGPESCNFWLKTSIPLAGNYFQRWWGLYNNGCKKIGGSDQSLSPTKNHYSLTSQLPYTIEFTDKGGGFRPAGHFWYAGRKTSLGKNMYCEDCGGLAASRCCRIAFRCR